MSKENKALCIANGAFDQLLRARHHMDMFEILIFMAFNQR